MHHDKATEQYRFFFIFLFKKAGNVSFIPLPEK